jgi:hypothetical protein
MPEKRPPAPGPRPLPDEKYRPISRRRRLLIFGLAIATAITVVLTLLYPPGGIQRPPPGAGPDRARCGAGQTTDCVGGKADVIVLPAAVPAAPSAPGAVAAPGAAAASSPR